MNNKVKEFVKKHKDEIKFWSGIALIVGGSGFIGYYAGRNTFRPNEIRVNNEVITNVFNDIQNGTRVGVFGGIAKTGVTPDQLGELGKIMVDSGVPNTRAFTHFVAISKVGEP